MEGKVALNYVEFASLNLSASKQFFNDVFDWEFTDYGSEYSAFSNAGFDGGFFSSDRVTQAQNGAPLIVFYTPNIHETQLKVERSGGVINKPIFAFPGGCRFHFVEPGGNELAVWSEAEN
jgi:predicted enzyme related to lactoylglutathione lyase